MQLSNRDPATAEVEAEAVVGSQEAEAQQEQAVPPRRLEAPVVQEAPSGKENTAEGKRSRGAHATREHMQVCDLNIDHKKKMRTNGVDAACCMHIYIYICMI